MKLQDLRTLGPSSLKREVMERLAERAVLAAETAVGLAALQGPETQLVVAGRREAPDPTGNGTRDLV